MYNYNNNKNCNIVNKITLFYFIFKLTALSKFCFYLIEFNKT